MRKINLHIPHQDITIVKSRQKFYEEISKNS